LFPVSEIFESLQGEGNAAGKKALFIRFHFCNLTCSWCDTKYTWLKKSGAFQNSSSEELQKLISDSPSHDIILTGGEPALHPLDQLHTNKKQIHVESNGSIIPIYPLTLTLSDKTEIKREAMDEAIISKWNWVISPKSKNAGQTLDPQSLAWWISRPYAVFKFVIKNETDILEVKKLCAEAGLALNRVYLSVEGTTRESQLVPELVEKIVTNGFHFSPRLHVLLWGNERKR
jgi:organic radical activating enzyme